MSDNVIDARITEESRTIDAQFDVLIGTGIQKVSEISHVGQVHTIEVVLTNGKKYTFTVNDGDTYDDTALKARVTAIEGKESGWDAKQDALTDDDKQEIANLAPQYDDTSLKARVSAIEAQESTWNGKVDVAGLNSAMSTVYNSAKTYTDGKVPTADITANTNARHTHSNESVLNGITAEKVTKWDSGTGSSYDDTALKNRISAIEAKETEWDANTSARHSHANMSYLNGLNDTYINNLIDTKLTPLETLADGILEVI